ncbi:hypothetical protein KR009_005186, partial [Drosophila setifemur]
NKLATPHNLAEYKAGRMTLQGKMVQPDDRKGLLYLRQSAGDKQVHIQWMDRGSGSVELDIVASPGTLEFRRVEECKTGRVYVLKYRDSVRRHFFWMQEPNPGNDADFCRRVNEILATANRDRNEFAAAEADLDSDVGRKRKRDPPAAVADQEPAPGHFKRGGGGSEDTKVIEEMRHLLKSNLLQTPLQLGQSFENFNANDNTQPLAFHDPDQPVPQPDLASVLRHEGGPAIADLLKSKQRRQNLMDRLPYDPEEDEDFAHGDAHVILENLRSPQFYEALGHFSYGLQSGVLRPILESQLPNKEALEAAEAGDIERFLRVLHDYQRDNSGPK